MTNLFVTLGSVIYPIIFGAILVLFIALVLKVFYKRIKANIALQNKKLLIEVSRMIEPKFIEFSSNTQDLLDLSVEIWRIKQRISKVNKSIPEKNKLSLESSIQKLYRYLERNDIELLDYAGEHYNENLSSVEVVSVEKNKNVEEDTITEVIEPGILVKGKLVKKSKVILTTKK